MKKKKRQTSTKLSPEMWLLIIAAIPFILLHWYIDGQYEKKNKAEEEKIPS